MSMVQYQFLLIDHDFLQAHFKLNLIKTSKEKGLFMIRLSIVLIIYIAINTNIIKASTEIPTIT